MPLTSARILVVDDNEDLLKAARLLLKQHFTRVDTEKNPENLPTLLRQEGYDVIMLDMNFTQDVTSGTEGFFWLDKILKIDPAAIVLLITAYGDVEMAVRAVKSGATDFILKPWSNEKLLATLFSALSLRKSKLEIEKLKSQNAIISRDQHARFGEMVGVSPAMHEVFGTIQKVAATDANVLILGENGTGKELIARSLHQNSNRARQAFISVDLGAISENLFESELFGHVKGAFTDAREDRAGRFEAADGGTIFLDEIGNLSLPMQAKLLTVLQSRQVTRVGSNRPKSIDIRLICATNMPLAEMITKGEFRQDLLYRINTIEIRIPALRERPEDIELLAHHYLRVYTQKYRKRIRDVSPPAIQRMTKYGWPGNVRELQHAIERAVIMCEKDMLQPEDLFISTAQKTPEKQASAETLSLDQFNLDELEKAIIRKVLNKHSGNISKAATELGLTRASLYRRLEKYGL
ncbi:MULTISPECIES: sigma-54 dependent transcriptional regulator [unclassified Siphonobacter]|uniref:sigma-54-dependent transcriptional regulator n=1 Tax=unclassified Siphonobacter TaxID=2635712 RepID=UPI000CBED790|nr:MULTISPECIES: sigma-54 dependent transcriptional regulator [unclassified Siphonobacter]MDQ1085792.1 DNA-binding NtrC family response regulator [Siphonobacter sp. SORGH_AS_1065]PKK35605.1 sigma-54-dependent Fis family transcriptional regulator [Siphonobacter sp. SORGH_AS_0500]